MRKTVSLYFSDVERNNENIKYLFKAAKRCQEKAQNILTKYLIYFECIRYWTRRVDYLKYLFVFFFLIFLKNKVGEKYIAISAHTNIGLCHHRLKYLHWNSYLLTLNKWSLIFSRLNTLMIHFIFHIPFLLSS